MLQGLFAFSFCFELMEHRQLVDLRGIVMCNEGIRTMVAGGSRVMCFPFGIAELDNALRFFKHAEHCN